MKRMLFALLPLALFLTAFAGCERIPDSLPDQSTEVTEQKGDLPSPAPVKDVWDGSVASSFAGGTGTSSDPYQIASSSQLAFLAKEINAGVVYSGKYFALQNDIDLNRIAWTPIGNGTYCFEGNFNGNGHTIANLNIVTANKHIKEYPHTTSVHGLVGLFGICRNATVCNLNLSRASVSVQNTESYDQIFAGTLIGRLESDSMSQISNITVTESELSLFAVENADTDATVVGGLIGYIIVTATGHSKLEAVQSKVDISCENSYWCYNLIGGGIAGYVLNENEFECSNFASYLTLYWKLETGRNYAGAFGQFVNTCRATVTLSHAFSEVRTNQPLIKWSDTHYYQANAIVGELSQVKNTNGEIEGAVFTFENLYGCVKPTDSNAGFLGAICKLYEIPSHATATEVNCQGCTVLPVHHGLNDSIWNLNSRFYPELSQYPIKVSEHRSEPDFSVVTDQTQYEQIREQFEKLIAPLPAEYQLVLSGETCYYDTLWKDYRNITNEFQWVTVVDMDGDGADEVLLQSLSLDITLYLHCIGDTVYGYRTAATVTVYADGSVHWGRTAYRGLEYGAQRYTFSETGWTAEQLYLVVNDGAEDAVYYVADQRVTEEELQVYFAQADNERAVWYCVPPAYFPPDDSNGK